MSTTLSPAEFAHFRLGEKGLYDCQYECLEAIGLQEHGGLPVSVVAANGSGKTAKIVAPAVLWFLEKYPRGQVVITSGSFRQIEKQLWPAMRVHAHKFAKWSFLQTEIKTDKGGFALGFSTVDPGKAEGWHPKISREDDPVFIIVDEAKTVPKAIFEAFDRCTRVFQLWVSSPGSPHGDFYDSFHADQNLFWTRKIKSKECPHIDPAKRARDLAKYGADSPIYRSMHDAEFTDLDESTVISSEDLTNALERVPDKVSGKMALFGDVAAGRDENVLAECRGNVARILYNWIDRDTYRAGNKFCKHFAERNAKGKEVWIDSDGLGIGFVNQMRNNSWMVNEFHGGIPAEDDEHYANLIAEAWFEAVNDIKAGKIHFVGGLDPETFRQITTRRVEWDERGRLKLESKDKMKERGLSSPDRADALLGAIYKARVAKGGFTKDSKVMTPSSSPWLTPSLRF